MNNLQGLICHKYQPTNRAINSNNDKNLAGRCIFNIRIYNCYNVTQLHIKYIENAKWATKLLDHNKRLITKCIWTTPKCLRKKNGKELETLMHTIRIRYRNGIWHEKCAMLIIKSGKRQITEEIELPNYEKMNSRRKGNLRVHGNIRSGHHQAIGDLKKNHKCISDEQENFSKRSS